MKKLYNMDMSIFVILLIIFFGALVLYDARMKFIVTNDKSEYDFLLLKNSEFNCKWRLQKNLKNYQMKLQKIMIKQF